MTTFKQGQLDLLVATPCDRGRRRRAEREPDGDRERRAHGPRTAAPAARPRRPRHGREHLRAALCPTPHPLARERLASCADTNDGFEVSRRDLELRGPGELLRTRQTGLMQLRVAELARDADLLPGVQRAADFDAGRPKGQHRRPAASLDRGRRTLRQGLTRQQQAHAQRHRHRRGITGLRRARAASRLREYARLMRLDRRSASGCCCAVLWALWISSDGHPDERLFVIFVLGTFVMRSPAA